MPGAYVIFAGRVTMPPSLLNTISNAELNSIHRFVGPNYNKDTIRCGSKVNMVLQWRAGRSSWTFSISE